MSRLFNSIVAALFDTYVIQITWAISNSFHAFVKHKDSSIISWMVHYFLIMWLAIQTLTSISCKPNLMPHLSTIERFPIVVLFDFVVDCWMVCLCCAIFYLIVRVKSDVFCWEKWTIFNYQKGKWHSNPIYFIYALVF